MTAPAQTADDEAPIDFDRPFIPEELTPLARVSAYAELEPRHRLRYNQLQAMYFNEQIMFFETIVGDAFVRALLQERLPRELGERLRKLRDDEAQHTAMFRRLNRDCAPQLYAGSDFHFIRVPRPLEALLRWTTRHPRLFGFYIWLLLLQEERSVHYSTRFLRAKNELEPRFVAVYRSHLLDEVQHVRCDLELLDLWWPRLPAGLRRFNARLLAWMVKEFFSAPKRGQLSVIEALGREFPELSPVVPEILHQVRSLRTSRAYQQTIYSREITPRSFARFDRWPEFRVMQQVIPGYEFASRAA
jgi:P-aminobenzoate N-oxygenase AurF